MNNVIIRIAKKDYVCSVCKHIIRAGEEYLDNVILHDGTAVRHERYHDECPVEDGFVSLAKAFAESDELLCVGPDKNKYRITGIHHPRTVLVEAWDKLSSKYIPYDIFKKEWEVQWT